MSSMQTTAIETSIKSNEHGEIENDGGTLNKNEDAPFAHKEISMNTTTTKKIHDNGIN